MEILLTRISTSFLFTVLCAVEKEIIKFNIYSTYMTVIRMYYSTLTWILTS